MSMQYVAGRHVEMSADELRETLGAERNFARVTGCAGNRVELAFDLDPERWRFLTLPAHHPILIEEYGYFAAVTASWATGLMTPGQHSALTRVAWTNLPPLFDGEHPCAGVVRFDPGAEFETRIELFRADGSRTTESHSRGFLFEAGEFEAMRTAAKAQLAPARVDAGAFPFLAAEAAALPAHRPCFLGPSRSEGPRTLIDALVTHKDFYPDHPDIEGSGDHVNAAHMLDACMQAAQLLLQPAQPLLCDGGSAAFRRFIELDVPFKISVERSSDDGGAGVSLAFTLQQAGQRNAEISLRLREQRPQR